MGNEQRRRGLQFWAAVAVGGGVVLLLIAVVTLKASYYWEPAKALVVGRSTVASRLSSLGPAARERMMPGFAKAGPAYPPTEVLLVAFKDVRRLEVYCRGTEPSGAWHRVRSYSILAASGSAGPKLREGDRQVPEGIYPIESLNPNSRFHLALRVGFPNAFDRAWANRDGRTRLGGDIMIHGADVSVGCLAMGDDAIQELFTLVADVGVVHCEVIIVPRDFRLQPPDAANESRGDLDNLYRTLHERLRQLPAD